MQQLAMLIREQLDTLVDQYDARLRTMPGYSSFPEAMRRDLERHFLNLIVQSLESGDYDLLVQYARERAAQWDARGLNLAWFQQALIVPEELLVPLVQSVETSNFVWQALNRSQSVVWQMVAAHAHQTEERFRSIVETAHSGIMIIDDQFRFIYANDQLTHICGYRQDELLGADFRELLDEDSRRIVAERYMRRQRGEDVPAEYELDFIRKDGEKRHVEMSAVLLQDADGKLQTIAQVLDVTERTQAETALEQSVANQQKSMQRLHAIIEATDELIQLRDLDVIYRRTVELAREKLGVERCGLFIIDPTGQFMLGTYGTDDQGRTSDEHAAREPIARHQTMYLAQEKIWVAQESPQTHWVDDEQHQDGTGWVVRSEEHTSELQSPCLASRMPSSA